MRMTPISGWDLEFCKMPQSTLFQVINVANFLDMKVRLSPALFLLYRQPNRATCVATLIVLISSPLPF